MAMSLVAILVSGSIIAFGQKLQGKNRTGGGS